jgi:endonuclease YncB( thermonuclease family)
MHTTHTTQKFFYTLTAILLLTRCTFGFEPRPTANPGGSNDTIADGETASVVRVVDGDTIRVRIDGREYSVRYVGINTPESDEACFIEARQANSALVEGQTVTLVKDTSETDRYDRLLRYIYVGSTFVNAELVRQGYAEVVLYPPDDAYFDQFRTLEDEARAANRGCHPSGIFNDGSYTR